MNFKFYIGFFSTIFVLLISNIKGQEFLQVCSEPGSFEDCEVSEIVPDYKTANYSYVIVRDTFATDVVKIGKSVNDFSSSAKTDLLADFYIPCNNATNRPLVLVTRPSGYTSEAGKSELDEHENFRYFLSEMAKKGYVVATYECRNYTRVYNQGFYFDISPNDSNGVTLDSCAVMAFVNGNSTETNNFYRCYACMVDAGEEDEAKAFAQLMMYNQRQDVFSLVNYSIEDPNDLGLNIDPNNVFLAGTSNGAQIALSSAYIDEIDYSSNPVGSIIINKYGDFNGTSQFEHISNDFEFKGAASFMGAANDINWIDSNDPATLMIHGTWDHKIPYQSNYISFVQHGDSSNFWIYGSEDVACKLREKQVDFGLITIDKGGHSVFRQNSACEPSEECGYYISDFVIDKTAKAFEFLYNGGANGMLVEAYFPASINCNSFVQMEYPIDYLKGPNGNGQCVPDSVHSAKNLQDLITYCNCYDPNPPQAPLYSQEQLKFFQDSNELELFPNPVREIITIKSAKGFSQGIIFDLNGRVVQSFIAKEEKKLFELNVTSLRRGIYVLSIGNESKRFIKMD